MTRFAMGWLLATLLFAVSGARAEVSDPATEELSSYTYGRFTIEVVREGDKPLRQTIVGGEFTPSPFPPQEPMYVLLSSTGFAPKHVIFIDYVRKELQYYRRGADDYLRPVIGYAVVTPKPEDLPHDVVSGLVTRIVKDPTWCPKVGGQIRRDDPSLPPGCFPPGHPLNAMGGYRFDIRWDVSGWQLIKLHGTDGYPVEFEKIETYGCTRLNDLELERLVTALGPTAVAEGIEIVAHRTVRKLRGLGM